MKTKNVTYSGKATSLVHLPHRPEPYDVHTAIQQTHKRTYEGKQRCGAGYWMGGCVDLQQREDSPTYTQLIEASRALLHTIATAQI